MLIEEPRPVSVQAPDVKETFVLNLGPQHPATHGVLRVKLTMDGEYIDRAEPVTGYIHRMHEKMGENRTYAQFLPNTSRIDYLAAMHYTHAFVQVVERAAGIEVPPRAEYIRVITSELNRISSHLVWFGAFVLDLGGFTPLQSAALSAVAARLGTTPMAVALAWLLQRSPNILLIPGTSSVAHLRENVAGAGLELTAEDLAELDSIGAAA